MHEGTTVIQWTPSIDNLGRVDAFAASNPNYEKGAASWRELPKQNDLNPSFFDFFNTARKLGVQQHYHNGN